jgi:hypothetical protein
MFISETMGRWTYKENLHWYVETERYCDELNTMSILDLDKQKLIRD